MFYVLLPLRMNFWMQQHKYNPNVDTFIEDILDRNVLGQLGQYTVAYGDVKVWIGSYPFSYATLHDAPIEGRASLYNLYRYKKYVTKLEEQNRKAKLGGMEEKEYLSLDRIAMKMMTEKE